MNVLNVLNIRNRTKINQVHIADTVYCRVVCTVRQSHLYENLYENFVTFEISGEAILYIYYYFGITASIVSGTF